MCTITCEPGLEIDHAGDVTVVRFTDRSLWNDEEIRVVADHLLDLVDDDGCRNLMLDFSDVVSAGSVMLTKLFVLHQKLKAVGGRLTFCNVGPFLNEIFDAVRLSDRVSIYG
jgi:anti-anti-sigma regulatory factor